MKVTEVSLEINSQHVAEDLRSCWMLNQLLHNDAVMSMLLRYVLKPQHLYIFIYTYKQMNRFLLNEFYVDYRIV